MDKNGLKHPQRSDITRSKYLFFFFLMIRPPPRPPLFPYTPLFRSGHGAESEGFLEQHAVDDEARSRDRPRAERQLGYTAPRVGEPLAVAHERPGVGDQDVRPAHRLDRESTRLNSSHSPISYAGLCL